MPFPQREGLPFDRETIESLTPRQKGCYGLFDESMRLIYVGKGDLRECLLKHLEGDSPHILAHNPVYWKAFITRNVESAAKKLIYELDPVCNR